MAGAFVAVKPVEGVRLGDLVSLTKPRITANVLFSTAVGMFLAPGHLGWGKTLVLLAGVGLVVGGANALNCYIERETDARMWRTRNRALAAGRIEPADGLLLGLTLAMVAVPLLSLAINSLTGFLALVALVSYVWVYTPLKRVTPKALLVGAVPGAIPPLLGWTAVTGRLDPGGCLLFAVMFVWQLPHFLAITLYLKDDYARGGHRVMPLVRGERRARIHLMLWTVALVPASLAFVWARLAGWPYAIAATLLGAGFLYQAFRGLKTSTGPENVRTARRIFHYSIVYLILLFGALVIDHLRLQSAAGFKGDPGSQQRVLLSRSAGNGWGGGSMSTAVLPVAEASLGTVRRRRLWIGGAGLLMVLAAAPWILRKQRQSPGVPVLYTLPHYSLLDEQGRAFGSDQLAGVPYIASFIYTSCRDSCPLITARMGELQDALAGAGPAVRLVSFTVDPERDTPARLLAYAGQARADPARWSFVTGPREQLQALLQDGFKVTMEGGGSMEGAGGGSMGRAVGSSIGGAVAGPREDAASSVPSHDNHLVLVDGRGRVRGYFPPSSEGLGQIRAALKRMVADAWRLQ